MSVQENFPEDRITRHVPELNQTPTNDNKDESRKKPIYMTNTNFRL